LAVVCAAQFVLQLDFSIVNVALPSIRAELGFKPSTLQWLVTGYALTFGSLLLFGGRLGDLVGQRRVLIIGLIVFGAASAACGLSSSPVMLIVARLIQGVGGALVSPSALSSLTKLYGDGSARVRALGVWQGATAAGATTGVIAGGILVDFVGWRSIFLINIPIVVALIAAVPTVLPRSRPASRAPLQLLPSLLVTIVIAALIYALSNTQSAGVTKLASVGLFPVAIVLAVVLVVTQRRATIPLVPRLLWRSKQRVGALIAMVIIGAVISGYVYFVSLYLQTVLRLTPLRTGLALLPATITLVLTSTFLVRRLIGRIGLRTTALTGAVFLAAGQGWFSFVTDAGTYNQNVLPALFLTGIGLGVTLPAVAVAATADVVPAVQGSAAAVLTTTQQIGTALGLATLATIAAARTAGAEGSLSAGFSAAFLIAAGLTACIGAVVAVSFGREPAPSPPSRSRRTKPVSRTP
jgi:EmrB/QacA subfamily drug resistance transporter